MKLKILKALACDIINITNMYKEMLPFLNRMDLEIPLTPT